MCTHYVHALKIQKEIHCFENDIYQPKSKTCKDTINQALQLFIFWQELSKVFLQLYTYEFNH